MWPSDWAILSLAELTGLQAVHNPGPGGLQGPQLLTGPSWRGPTGPGLSFLVPLLTHLCAHKRNEAPSRDAGDLLWQQLLAPSVQARPHCHSSFWVGSAGDTLA